MDFNHFEQLIKNSTKILIMTHINPDGDALGSASSMYTTIYDTFKKKSDILIIGHLPNCYKFLPNIDKCSLEYDSSMVYDLVICLDVASLDRLSNAKILFAIQFECVQ